tara:strand:+ start:1054 stop:1221 length:168 start_codon:yes stop_codon:yes gene_type:complete
MKTTYPPKPFKDYETWRNWQKEVAAKVMTPEDKFEAAFMRIWSDYKRSIIKARTK